MMVRWLFPRDWIPRLIIKSSRAIRVVSLAPKGDGRADDMSTSKAPKSLGRHVASRRLAWRPKTGVLHFLEPLIACSGPFRHLKSRLAAQHLAHRPSRTARLAAEDDFQAYSRPRNANHATFAPPAGTATNIGISAARTPKAVPEYSTGQETRRGAERGQRLLVQRARNRVPGSIRSRRLPGMLPASTRPSETPPRPV